MTRIIYLLASGVHHKNNLFTISEVHHKNNLFTISGVHDKNNLFTSFRSSSQE